MLHWSSSVCLQMRDALFPALVAIGYCHEPDTDAPDWLSVRCAKDAARILVDSAANDVDFESADVVLRDSVVLAKDLVEGDFEAARQLLCDRRAQLHTRMAEAIKMRHDVEANVAGARKDKISGMCSRTCLAAMRHVLNVARDAGLNTCEGTGRCDDHDRPLDLFDAAARVTALLGDEAEHVLKHALENFDALQAWGYERHLWHDYILRAAPLVAAGDATATVDLAAVTNLFETRRYADFAIGDVAYHVYVPI